MTITLTADDVRDAGDLDATDYPDSDLQFEVDYAEGLVNDRLSPPPSDTTAYVQTAALLGAALAVDGKTVTDVSLGNQSLSFESDESLSLLEMAYARDPTDKLQNIVEPDEDEPFVFTR